MGNERAYHLIMLTEQSLAQGSYTFEYENDV